MRTIGVKNRNLVKRITRIVMEEIENSFLVEEAVVNALPVSLWDTWEMADQEIRRIISDTIFEGDIK